MTNEASRRSLGDFKTCADEAPQGCYEEAKALNVLIGDTCDRFMQELRRLGLKADACDRAYALEAAIYEYAKASNPDATLFPVAEGFGAGLNGPVRQRVLAQATANRDALRQLSSVTGPAPGGLPN